MDEYFNSLSVKQTCCTADLDSQLICQSGSHFTEVYLFLSLVPMFVNRFHVSLLHKFLHTLFRPTVLTNEYNTLIKNTVELDTKFCEGTYLIQRELFASTAIIFAVPGLQLLPLSP